MRTNNKAINNGKTNQILREIRSKSMNKMRINNRSNKRKEEKLWLIKSWSQR